MRKDLETRTQEEIIKHHASIRELKKSFMESVPAPRPSEWDKRLSTHSPFRTLSFNGQVQTGTDGVKRALVLPTERKVCGSETQGEAPGQGEDLVKPSGKDHRVILPKVSIPMPEEKSMEKCRLHLLLLPNPRLPFLMSFLIFLAVTLWWLLFL
ncbi:unnamed protein product [Staurois parvus]|uniref:SAB domain-containing protein n=1 Tax=Staurois parvus TaxID=386267 RepID=A0ABN9FDA5_9NEOB|nr:unnamed protein product [Staurois parvus]